MTATIGLERLPRAAVALLAEAAGNLRAVANELDALVAHAEPLDAVERHEQEGDRITHDLIDVARRSRRAGPDRQRVVELAQDVDDVVDAVTDLAWSWSRLPLAELTELMLTVRDAVRSASVAVRELDDPEAALDRCLEAARAADSASRAARAWLLTEQPDPRLAVAGQSIVDRAAACVRACLRLHRRIERDALS